jgi:class 3 adenylate cyclase
MPSSPLLIDAGDPLLREKLDGLPPSPGYCIFIDVVGSTAMKQKSMREWVALIHNCFANAKTFLTAFRPLKGIGDELMYFIEESDLKGETALTIYDGLFQIAKDTNAAFPATKIVAAYCSSVYPMTFIQGSRDYYGIDVDRAARLKSISPPPAEREVVIDSEMYSRVKAQYDWTGNKSDFECFLQLKGPTSHNAKGIPDPIRVYRTVQA